MIPCIYKSLSSNGRLAYCIISLLPDRLPCYSSEASLASFITGLNTSLSASTSEDFTTIGGRMDWSEIQAQLTRDTDVTVSFKSCQTNLVNRILTNANYAPEW